MEYTYCDKRAIEIWSADIASRLGFSAPPVSLTKKNTCIDINTECMERNAHEEFAQLLAKKLELAGWECDVWPIFPGRVAVRDKVTRHTKRR